MGDMLATVYVSVGVSVFVAGLFIVMSVNFVIAERQAEYAILKCLGYQRGRLGATILAQALGEVGLASLISVPLGIAVGLYLNRRLTHAWFEVIPIVRPGDVAQVLGLALILVPACLYPGLRMLNRLDIAAALASRNIE
jgi:ABC-type antimicrobial peptide transport system permease subunit